MKPYHISHDSSTPVTTVTWSTVLEADVLGQAIAELDAPETHPAVLWDFSAVREVKINLSQVQLLARRLREQSSRLRPTGKTAVLGPSDLLFGLARQAHAIALLLSDNPPIEIFREREPALIWLKSPTRPS